MSLARPCESSAIYSFILKKSVERCSDAAAASPDLSTMSDTQRNSSPLLGLLGKSVSTIMPGIVAPRAAQPALAAQPSSQNRKKARSGAPGGRGRQIGEETDGTKVRRNVRHAAIQRAVFGSVHPLLPLLAHARHFCFPRFSETPP